MLQYVEYGYYDYASGEQETKDIVNTAIKLAPSTISVLPQYVKLIKKSLPDHIKLGTIIDYPFGLSNYPDRESAVLSAIKNGANSIEIVCPNYALCNRRYDKFRLEIDTLKALCSNNNVDLKYVLEYKIYTLNLLHKVSEILFLKQLTTTYISSSFFIDSISDNILAAMMLQKKNPNLQLIVTGQAWTDKQIDLILSNPHLFAYKTNNIYTLEKIIRKI
jgi:deoxyribose-phosphate aldolase